MLKSLYTPLSGAVAQQRVLEIIANNLANVNTTGFKGDRITFKLLESEPENKYVDPLPPANYKVGIEELMYLKGNDHRYVGVADLTRDLAQGPANHTENPLDVMIEGPGYFEVMTQDGVRYTRDGSFNVNADGILTTKSGAPVLGDKGDIALRAGDFEINGLGEIWQDGEMVDRLRLLTFSDPAQLERSGNNLLFYGGPDEGRNAVEFAAVRQGWLEGSNINPVRSLTNMIMAHRSYEAYQKALRNYDQIMEKSSNVIGEIRA